MELLKGIIGKPLLNAGIAYGLSRYVYGVEGPVDTIVGAIDSNLLIAGASSAGTLVGEMVGNLMLPHLPKDEKYSRLEGMVLTPTTAGLGTVIATNLFTIPAGIQPGFNNLFQQFSVGALSEIGAEYSYNVLEQLMEDYQ